MCKTGLFARTTEFGTCSRPSVGLHHVLLESAWGVSLSLSLFLSLSLSLSLALLGPRSAQFVLTRPTYFGKGSVYTKGACPSIVWRAFQ